MPTLPAGFHTRPEAAKIYRRSQRALERDLDQALTLQDAEVLAHWRLATKEGEIREAKDVTTDIVKDLVADGATPTWYVAGEYLAEKFGRRDGPKQTQKTANPTQDSPVKSASQRTELPDDVSFLKELIAEMRRDLEAERTRMEQREEQLYAQLKVKDEQIKRWDEVSQTLTKALATGQLSPVLPSPTAPPPEPPNVVSVVETKPKKGTPEQPKKKVTRKRKPTKRKAKRKPKPSKWFETPTLKKFFTR